MSVLFLGLLLTGFLVPFLRMQSGKADPSTLIVPDDYPTIQSAINAANPGDTVFVSLGTYYENVIVNKTLSLLGENWETTIIDGNSSGTSIMCSEESDARICNFTIQNGQNGVSLYQTTNITISQNLVQNVSGSGIFIEDSGQAHVKGNEIVNNGVGVASWDYVTDCVFEENNIAGNAEGGINAGESFWLENSIIGNNITDNQYYGISLYSYHAMASGNSIVGNSIANNEGGILLYSSCVNNTVSENNISANAGWGISLESGSSNNTISGNIITDNENGILMNTGMSICSNNSVVRNKLEANDGYGILLQYAINNSLSGNNIANNLRGLSLDVAAYWGGDELEMGSEGNLICGNDIVGNSVSGIEVLNSSNNLIYDNNFKSNTAQVLSQSSSNIWDDGYPSAGNYWSDYAGGADLYRGSAQDENGSDGIVDLPYTINAGNRDNYPLMRPRASTRIVPDDYPTIQAAIDAAIDGDIVFVRNGTYNENVFIDKSLVLMGDNNNAINNGNGTGTGFYIAGTPETPLTTNITGFTIQNFKIGIGGALDTWNPLYVYGNVFLSNNAGISLVEWYGGGLICKNVFSNNAFGIDLGGRGNPIDVRDNTILYSNVSGISISYLINPNVCNNYIAGNSYGLSISEDWAGGLCQNNTFRNNDCGLFLAEVSNYEPIIHNNFVNNSRQVVLSGPPKFFTWDTGYPSGGNYWSDYNGIDLYSGQYQNITGSDGIGDTPYIIDSDQQDNYPFTKPLALQPPQLPSPLPPMARFSYEPAHPVVNETITFDALASVDFDGSVVNYQWDFGEGGNLTGTNPVVTYFYDSVGSYAVVLTVTDNDGYNGTWTKIVSVGKIGSDISIMADPSPITIRGETTISGTVNPIRPGANVTIWYEPPDALTWKILANVTTEPSSNYSYSWLPSKTGAYKLQATWAGDEYTFENESAPIDFECLNVSSSISISTSCASTYVGYRVNITGTLEDMYGNGLASETVVLYYTFRGTTIWTPITSDETDSLGNYFAVWIPPATGNFIIKAEWAGNATHSGVDGIATLSSVLYNYEYVFSVESNSTVSSLAYDSQNQRLSFLVNGTEGTEGYTRVTIAKTLVSNITDLKIHFDGIEYEYIAEDLGESWVLTFTYTHSIHQIEIAFNLIPIPEYSLPYFVALSLIIVMLATIMHRKKRSL